MIVVSDASPLKVFTRNTIAIDLYKKSGFIEEGRQRRALLKQGVWVDEYTMALILDENPPSP